MDRKRIIFVDPNYEWGKLMEGALETYSFYMFNSLEKAQLWVTPNLGTIDLIISEQTFEKKDDGLTWLKELKQGGNNVLLFTMKGENPVDETFSIPFLGKESWCLLTIKNLVRELLTP